MERGKERDGGAVEADAVFAVLCLLLCRSLCGCMFFLKMIALSV